jgi:hypothetical protein
LAKPAKVARLVNKVSGGKDREDAAASVARLHLRVRLLVFPTAT